MLDWYYLAFPRDKIVIKCLVGLTFIADTAQTIIIMNDSFRKYADYDGDYVKLNAMMNEWLAVPVLTAIGMSCVASCITHSGVNEYLHAQ